MADHETARQAGFSSHASAFCVIPARLGSTRLPGKPLARETGKYLIEHVYEAAGRAQLPRGVGVATDAPEVCRAVQGFGGQAWLTSPHHASGTDRVAEVARNWLDDEIIVNVQGDEPDIAPEAIDRVIEMLREDTTAVMATLATPIRDRHQWLDPACVKVVFDTEGNSLYFSRSPLPYIREGEPDFEADPPRIFQHVGMYGYRRGFLLQLTEMPPSPLERLERLEQLRALENGHRIKVAVIDEPSFGIDTPEDYRRFVAAHRQA